MATHVCRVCIASNVRMHRIDANGLQEMFEKVTNTKLKTDERPLTMCYICLPQLQKSYRFLQMCQAAEEAFTDLIKNGIEVKNNSLAMLNLASIQYLSLSVDPTKFLTLDDDDSTNESSQVAVKEEFNDIKESAHIDHIVKDEMDEQHFQVEESIVSMNCNNVFYVTEVQIKVEENEENANTNIVKDEMVVDTGHFQTVKGIYPSNTDKTETYYECHYCTKKVKTKTILVRHIKRHMGIKASFCNFCAKAFINKTKLKWHMKIHTGEKLFSCNICTMTFKKRSYLSHHMKTHMGEKPHSCNTCNKAFILLSNLKRHMRIHTGEKPFSCNICDQSFSYNSALKQHMESHTGEKLLTCNRCDKAFPSNSHLKTHLRTHTGDKPFSCNRCDKAFAQRGHLKQHLVIHTGEKPYSCNICNKAFSRSNLKVHMRSHTGEKPYSCNICNKSVASKSILQQHMRTHTGEKPYSCHICAKAFSANHNLKIHLRTHSEANPYICDICGKPFSCSDYLHRHMKTHNKINRLALIQAKVKSNVWNQETLRTYVRKGAKTYTPQVHCAPE